MCGKSSIARSSGFRNGRGVRENFGGRIDRPGPEVEYMSPGTRIAAAIAAAVSVLAPVMLSGVFLVAFVPQLWWVFTTYAWVSFPAFGTLASEIAGLASGPSQKQLGRDSAGKAERELLGALRDHGELTPARAAIETSLSVSEADEKLKELAEGGYLEVRVRGGGLFYAFWEGEKPGETRKPASLQLERQQVKRLGTWAATVHRLVAPPRTGGVL